MNAPQTLYQVSHSFRISRYGAHTSLSTVERIDVIEVLMQMSGTTLSLQAQLDCLRQMLRNVSFLPVRQLFQQLARTTADYARFLAISIVDLGGYVEPAGLYRFNEVAHSHRFADYLTEIKRSTSRLQAEVNGLRAHQQSAEAKNDLASKRLFEECARRHARLLRLISSHLLHE
ncbi:hypothetical protein [Pseudomonas granadensis]|uniref:hypothetical protein n=1 Tax=Pseudomonas granadensis TaxID=1421430 RepID=UPI00087B3EE0|nr:hypothetical protein [Pseudomonas granadensis]SDS96513.1 hypothetical protein SAMN05216579_2109 [Pseudomonas granadensis]